MERSAILGKKEEKKKGEKEEIQREREGGGGGKRRGKKKEEGDRENEKDREGGERAEAPQWPGRAQRTAVKSWFSFADFEVGSFSRPQIHCISYPRIPPHPIPDPWASGVSSCLHSPFSL